MIDVPREFWGRPEAFQRYLEAQGLSSKKNRDVSQFRAPDIDKGLPNIEARLLAPLEKPRTKSAGYVRDFAPVSFEPRPFQPQPVSTVKWRGRGGVACPTITLACNSISASKSKCGYPEFSGFESTPPKFFKKKEQNVDTVIGISCNGTIGCRTGQHYVSNTIQEYTTHDTAPLCRLGSPTYSGSRVDTLCDGSTSTVGNGDDFVTGAPRFNPISGISAVYDNTVSHSAGSYGAGCSAATDTDHVDVTLSDEDTTDDLKARAIAALPEYGSSSTCSAFRNLSTDETSYTIRRFKYKFKFPNPGMDGYLKILWNETFKPTLSAGVTYCGSSYAAGAEDPNPAHWTTSAMSEVFGSGDTESSEHEVTEPSSNGTIYVTDIRWTKTEGCEPDASSIEGVDQFASNTSDTYLCNDRDPADKNCTCPE